MYGLHGSSWKKQYRRETTPRMSFRRLQDATAFEMPMVTITAHESSFSDGDVIRQTLAKPLPTEGIRSGIQVIRQ